MANGEGMLVGHMMPQACVEKRIRFDAVDLKKHSQHLPPLGQDHGHQRFNADGVVVEDGRDATWRGFSQLLRDGRLEAATSPVVFPKQQNGAKYLSDRICETSLLKLVPAYLRFCASITIEPPVWLFAAISGVTGVRMQLNADWGDLSELTIDRPVLHLPEAEITNLEVKTDDLLRPLFDAMWQAAGIERSLNYDTDGNRQERRR
jgi:hypothetical protein